MTVSLPLEDQWGDIRDAVAKLCEPFDNAYWNDLDAKSEYPHAFVDALTEAGWLGALIPEEYGGAGLPIAAGGAILETIHAAGCNAAACHAQMYTMGTVLRHGSEEQKQKYNSQKYQPGMGGIKIKITPKATPSNIMKISRL